VADQIFASLVASRVHLANSAVEFSVAGSDAPYPPQRTPISRALAGEASHVEDLEVRHPRGGRWPSRSGAAPWGTPAPWSSWPSDPDQDPPTNPTPPCARRIGLRVQSPEPPGNEGQRRQSDEEQGEPREQCEQEHSPRVTRRACRF